MTPGPEYRDVERPFLDQLAGLGWKVVTGNEVDPTVSGRDSFREVLLRRDLKKALRRLNLRDGEPWLDDARLAQAVNALERIPGRLMEANQMATELLLEGLTVEGLPDWLGGRNQTLRYIDWDHPERNAFLAVSQFRVDTPGGLGKRYIVPDVVLFVNGIPLGVVECKSPMASEPMAVAIDQLRRYQNARKAAGEVTENEGNERLFHTNQVVVATCDDVARMAGIGADLDSFMEWKDTAPVPLSQVREERGRERLSSQDRLVAGALRPRHLLDLVRHFTLFDQKAGRSVKIVGRYQQFRAVQAAVERLRHGETRREDGEHDRRGGIIWHTQGSGKSLTMVFLVRKMRDLPDLRRFKVVVVTDRKDLERQLSDTATLTGETVRVAKHIGDLKTLLSREGPEMVFAMIQKYGERDLESETPDSGEDGEGKDKKKIVSLGVLNKDESILVLVDEAHRSHSSTFHAHLMDALPNAARIGFTGTPILMGAKKRTHDIFGEFIDRYTLQQSEDDGMTVPILYEGRTAEGAVTEGRDLDELFEDLCRDLSDEEMEAIRRKYGTRGAIQEAERMIDAKARDMLRHYVEHILPNGLKAHLVAYSRRAAVRYQHALEEARDELVTEAEALHEETRVLDDVELEDRPRALRAAVRAARHLELLRRLEFGVVISPGPNDDEAWSRWSDAGRIETRIERFKKLLPDPDAEPGSPRGDPKKTDPLAFLIVKSMLLTGFDASIEGVMYLDRPIREAELLQAVARVNRTGHGKEAGIVVDYYGVARHLEEALAAYSAGDVEGALRSLGDELPKLRARHQRVVSLFDSRGVDFRRDTDEAIFLLEEERLRAEFAVKLKQFLATLDLVLPRPEALPFVSDARKLGEIHHRARKRYRGEGLPELSKAIGRKVQRLIDEHVISLGIDPKIPPISLTDKDFGAHVDRQASDRAKASEMEHALRYEIRKKWQEDPVRYRKLSERLEEILERYEENWKQQMLAFRDLIDEAHRGRQEAEVPGLDPATEMPFFDLLREEREAEGMVSGADRDELARCTRVLVELIRDHVRRVDFWGNSTRQEELHSQIFIFLDDQEVVDFERADTVADQVMAVAKANHDKLMKQAAS